MCIRDRSIKIEESVYSEDKDMIEDLILVAINQAIKNASNASDEKMNSVTGGLMGNMKLPGM